MSTNLKKYKLILEAVVVASLAIASVAYAASVVSNNKVVYSENYGNDRAQIEDLMARYLFALDWQDADAYAATFTENGVLDWAQGIAKGREAIRKEIQGAHEYFDGLADQDKPLRRARLHHFITNAAIKINGDKADVRTLWFEMYNRNPERLGHAEGYGHSVDQLRKVNGQWLFSYRKIYNEQMDNRAAGDVNPAW